MKILKNKKIINNLINEIIFDDDTMWSYIGYFNNQFVLTRLENLVGDKYLVFELTLNKKLISSKMRIYMQNPNNDGVLEIKTIYYSKKLRELFAYVINSLTIDDDSIDEINELKKLLNIRK